jgi:hypothetical protein
MNEAEGNGIVQISDDDLLYRRFYYKSLRRDGSLTPAAYTLPRTTIPDPEISVDLVSLTTPARTLGSVDNSLFGLGELKVGDVRKLGFTVRHQPIEENLAQGIEENYAHSIIEGLKTEEDCDRLAGITRVHTLPRRKSST